jgi:hypothetical protein
MGATVVTTANSGCFDAVCASGVSAKANAPDGCQPAKAATTVKARARRMQVIVAAPVVRRRGDGGEVGATLSRDSGSRRLRLSSMGIRCRRRVTRRVTGGAVSFFAHNRSKVDRNPQLVRERSSAEKAAAPDATSRASPRRVGAGGGVEIDGRAVDFQWPGSDGCRQTHRAAHHIARLRSPNTCSDPTPTALHWSADARIAVTVSALAAVSGAGRSA